MTDAVYIDCSAQMRALLSPDRLARLPGLRIHEGDPDTSRLKDLIGEAPLVLNGHTPMPAALLESLPTLRRIVFLGTGASSYVDLDAADRLGIEVRTVRGYGDRSVAEHALALMLAVARRVVEMDTAMRGGAWQPLDGLQLAGRTAGIVGLGGTGAQTARICGALGMRVLGWSRRSSAADAVCEPASLETLLHEADIVSLHLALTPETQGVIGRDRLARMKPGAILINTARGALVDESALVAALRDRRLSGAGLDVFAEEPLPEGSPLRHRPEVVMTPHAAFKTREAAVHLLEGALEAAQ